MNLIWAGLALVVGWVVVRTVPDLARYAKMRRM